MTKEERKEYMRIWRSNNKDRIKSYSVDLDRKRELARGYYKKNKGKKKEYQKEYQRNRRAQDPLFRLSAILRTGLGNSLRRNCFSKNCKTESVLGCSYEEFKNHIESLWETWMTWENYGRWNGEPNYGWDLDHITPVSSAKTQEEVEKLYHWTNFQPLCSHINRYVKIAL